MGSLGDGLLEYHLSYAPNPFFYGANLPSCTGGVWVDEIKVTGQPDFRGTFLCRLVYEFGIPGMRWGDRIDSRGSIRVQAALRSWMHGREAADAAPE